ncbi:MFS transporter [Streptomyces violarus]|uniref:MFS family permease n=1 Tax=Streptomyces violarus TaxID=67380 RepID=A0A7W4ZM66_9ACTN|nr:MULTISPECIES: MFS transporter [Streptomyces]MBB3075080.1 MFS family permease [Streptomyces violarus]WRT97715.1 MFS transporter [Streptomyces sp. CGMCC 4.1772]GHD02149.1 MFS transporter [Streptomyces violarus]
MLTRVLPPPGPARMLTFITMVMSLGQGLWMAINAIYAVTMVRLTPSQLGVSVGIAAALVLVSSIPLGHLADRAGPRTVQMWSFLALAPLTAALVFVEGFWSYLIVTSVQGLAYRAGNNARKAMIAANVPKGERAQVMAYIRAALNVTMSIGACISGLVLAWGERVGYQGAVLFTALCFLATGLLTLKEAPVPPVPASAGAAFAVLRDMPFLAFTALDGLLVTHALLLDIVLPLWVISHTDAPRWMSAAILLVNTAFVVAFQTRAARGTDDPRSASWASLQGAGCVAAACLVFATTGGSGMLTACVLLVLGALVHALGEIRHAAGSWTIAYDLAPDHAQGQYQGTYKMGGDVGKMFAPALFTWLVIGHGATGWIVLAVAYALLGAAMPAVVARGVRSRAATAEKAAAAA